jgi:aldose 1-epimerase
MRAPTGKQFEISLETKAGLARAIVTEVAAGLRHYSVREIDLAEPFAESQTPPSGIGIVLVPWPNRVKDGLWQLDGEPQQLDLTEPDKNNAIHGLLRHAPYTLVDHGESSVTLAATVFPQHGYPFLLDTTVHYELVEDGLTVTHEIRNAGDAKAPVAVGTHPYFKIGDVPTGDLTLTLSASSHFEVDGHLNVLSEHSVDGTEYDLRGGKKVADLSLDDGFGQVARTDGRSEQVLTAPDGRSIAMWGDESVGYVQVYTSRTLPTETISGVAIAIEPMTAPTNALNSGDGLKWLEPGESWSVQWGYRHSGF